MQSNVVITIAIRLRYDYDPTTTYRARLFPFDAIRREQKMNVSIFRRVVVVSQSNRTQIVISITSVVVECVVVSSYRSRFVVESQLWYRFKAISALFFFLGGGHFWQILGQIAA